MSAKGRARLLLRSSSACRNAPRRLPRRRTASGLSPRRKSGPRTIPGRRRRAGPAAESRGSSITLLVNRAEGGARYVMPDLIGTPGRRVADILRRDGFLVAITGETPTRPSGRHRHPADAAGRFPDCVRRADLARGQPMSVGSRRRSCRPTSRTWPTRSGVSRPAAPT